jgi:nitrogen fixation protein FixH
MTRAIKTGFSILAVFAVATAAACSKQEPPASQAQAGNAEITFKSDPETPKIGDNTFEVMVMQDGKPVDDAQVSVEFHMAAMPQMNMAEMRTQADLKPVGSGMYRGTGQMMMAGTWDVTVMAMRNGQEIAAKKLTVTAK